MHKISRREALAGAAAGIAIAGKTARASQANSAVTLGMIGTGGRGRFDGGLFAKDGRARIVALCDISSEAIDKAKPPFPARTRRGCTRTTASFWRTRPSTRC